MKLLRLGLTDVHGRVSQDFDTTAPVCVVGPNRAGKSTVLRAALMILTGDVSPLGRPPVDAVLEATFDVDGARVVHGVVVPAAGGVEHMIKRRSTPTKAALAEREKLLGKAGAWSVDDFLALSTAKRTAWLAQNIQAEAWDLDEVLAELQLVVDGGADPRLNVDLDPTEREAAHADLVARGRATVEKRVQIVQTSGTVLLETFTAEVARLAKVAQADKLSLEKAIKQDEADEKTRAPTLPPGTVAQWDDRATVLTREINTIDQSLKESDAARLRVQRRETRQTAVSGQQLQLTTQLNTLRAQVDNTAALTQEVATLRTDFEAKSAAVVRAEDRHKTESDARNKLAGDYAAAQTKHARLSAARAAAGSYAPLVTAAQAWGALLSDVGITGEALEQVLATETTNDVDTDRIHDVVTSLAAAITSAPAMPVEADVTQAAEELKELERRGAVARQLMDSAARLLRDAITAKGDAERDIKLKEAQLANEAVAVKARATRDADLVTQIANVEREVEALREEAASEPVLSNDDDARALIVEKRKLLAQATQRRDVLNDAVQAMETLARRRTDLEAKEADAKALRVMLAACHTTRAALMARDADPIAEVAGDIVRDVLGSELSVRDGDVRITTAKGVNYSVDTASDGERVVVLMAFALAVRSRLPGWRPAFVDRLDALEPDLRAKFAAKLLDLHAAGKVDNVMIALHGDASVAPAGYAIIELEAP